MPNILVHRSLRTQLNSVPVVGVDSIFSKAFKPSNGLISETHFELQELAIVVPASDGTGVSYANNEQSSGYGVPAGLAIEERNVRRSFCAVMIIQDLSEVLPSRNVDNGSRISGIKLGHDEAVAVLRVWLVSSASKGLKENPYLLFAVVLKKTVHVSPSAANIVK